MYVQTVFVQANSSKSFYAAKLKKRNSSSLQAPLDQTPKLPVDSQTH